jgi:D-sedoheptulose 7-phosphate isomerase
MLTMMVNDFGYENAYMKYLEYHVEKDTLVILISSSGESENIMKCQKYCEDNEIAYGVLTGFNQNNRLRTRSKNALWNYYINSEDYGVVECVHQIFLHGVV